MSPQLIPPDHPLIFYNGRWDASHCSWWSGTGLILQFDSQPSQITLLLGSKTTSPSTTISVSVNSTKDWVNLEVKEGRNVVVLPPSSSQGSSAVRIVSADYQNNRLELLGIEVEESHHLEQYKPKPLAFEIIGDSLTAGGLYTPVGAVGSWGYQVADALNAEITTPAQPGMALVDKPCWGNERGMLFQYTQVEDSGFYNDPSKVDRPTTPFDFSEQQPTPTHLVILLGANDHSEGGSEIKTSPEQFKVALSTFLTTLRSLRETQPIFVVSSIGWPQSEGVENIHWFPTIFEEVVDERNSQGDHSVFLVDASKWTKWGDSRPEDNHPNPQGQAKIAAAFLAWFRSWEEKQSPRS